MDYDLANARFEPSRDHCIVFLGGSLLSWCLSSPWAGGGGVGVVVGVGEGVGWRVVLCINFD